MILTQAPIIGLGIYAVTGIISISIHGSSMSKLNKVRRILWMH